MIRLDVKWSAPVLPVSLKLEKGAALAGLVASQSSSASAVAAPNAEQHMD